MVVRVTLTHGAADLSDGGAVAALSAGDAAATGSHGGVVATVLEIREEKVLVQLGKPEASRDALV
jgi:hypothetical protein